LTVVSARNTSISSRERAPLLALTSATFLS